MYMQMEKIMSAIYIMYICYVGTIYVYKNTT